MKFCSCYYKTKISIQIIIRRLIPRNQRWQMRVLNQITHAVSCEILGAK